MKQFQIQDKDRYILCTPAELNPNFMYKKVIPFIFNTVSAFPKEIRDDYFSGKVKCGLSYPNIDPALFMEYELWNLELSNGEQDKEIEKPSIPPEFVNAKQYYFLISKIYDSQKILQIMYDLQMSLEWQDQLEDTNFVAPRLAEALIGNKSTPEQKDKLVQKILDSGIGISKMHQNPYNKTKEEIINSIKITIPKDQLESPISLQTAIDLSHIKNPMTIEKIIIQYILEICKIYFQYISQTDMDFEGINTLGKGLLEI